MDGLLLIHGQGQKGCEIKIDSLKIFGVALSELILDHFEIIGMEFFRLHEETAVLAVLGDDGIHP